MARRLTPSECAELLEDLEQLADAKQAPWLDRCNLFSEVLRTSYLYATDDEVQRFATLAARQLYVHQALGVPEQLARNLEYHRRKIHRALLTKTEYPHEQLRDAIEALQCWIEWHRNKAAQPIAAQPQVPDETDTSLQPLSVRMVVSDRHTVHDSKGEAIPTFSGVVEATSERITLHLHDRWRAMGNLIRSGTVLHIIAGRWSDTNTLHCGSQALLVLEPDLLLDVTTVAECFTGNFNSHLLALLRLFATETTKGASAVVGTVVNACFDELLSDPTVSIGAAIDRALRMRYLDVLAAINSQSLSISSLQSDIEPHIATIQSVLPHLDKGRLTTEPTFLAPHYGIQGRLDVLSETEGDWRSVVELKSGSAPPSNLLLAASSGKSFSIGMRPNHAMQIAGYNLLLDAAYPGRTGSSQILYSAAPDAPLRNAPNAHDLKADFLVMRNRIVAMYVALAQRLFGDLDHLLRLDTHTLPPFHQSAFAQWKSAMGSLTDQEALYIRALISFAFAEWIAQLVGNPWRLSGYATLWRLSIPEKTEQLLALTYLRYDPEGSDITRGYLAFTFSDQTPRTTPFRAGDIAVLYPHTALTSDGSIQGQVFKCSIRELGDVKVVVSLRNKLFDRTVFTDDQWWALDADILSTNIDTMVRACAEFTLLPQQRRQLLLGLVPPRTEPRSVQRPARLTDAQFAVYSAAIGARDYFLLEGPPGTGKTSTMLRALVEHLLTDERETLLCAALTNRAVDEICSALKHLAGDGLLLRMGSIESTEHPALAFAGAARTRPFDELQQLVERARIIVATVPYLNANPSVFTLKRFTTAIIDEAAQLVEPQVVGIVSRVERFIMIGDAHQLPAVVQQSERSMRVSHPLLDAIELRRLDTSLFERLLRIAQRNGWHHAWGRLTEQARMHHIVAQFPGTRFYGREFGTLHAWQRNDPALLPYEQLPSFLRHRLVFVDTSPELHQGYNVGEARLVAACTTALATVLDPLPSNTLGIIAPFRKQIRTIIEQLPEALRAQVTVDTVERFQGSQRDHIIISCAINQPSDLRLIESIIELDGRPVDRKLNVALTRARHQVIVVGCRRILEHNTIFAELIAHIERTGIVLSASEALEMLGNCSV